MHFKENINLTIWIKLQQIVEYFSPFSPTSMSSNIIFGIAVTCDRLHGSFPSLLVPAPNLGSQMVIVMINGSQGKTLILYFCLLKIATTTALSFLDAITYTQQAAPTDSQVSASDQLVSKTNALLRGEGGGWWWWWCQN